MIDQSFLEEKMDETIGNSPRKKKKKKKKGAEKVFPI
jgi:hypothetical protein